jgi:hypothetical protein
MKSFRSLIVRSIPSVMELMPNCTARPSNGLSEAGSRAVGIGNASKRRGSSPVLVYQPVRYDIYELDQQTPGAKQSKQFFYGLSKIAQP